jgi:4-carboxymuconolactone decarboxylase
MKSLKVILLMIILGFFVLLIGCATLEKGSGNRVRLKEPRIKPLAESELTPETQKLLKNTRRTKDGQIFNIYTTFANYPQMTEKWFGGFANHVYSGSSLSPRHREILILRIGWLCRAEYEFGQHTDIGKTVGLTDEEIKRITEGPKAAGWDPFEATLVRATDELYYDAFITDATWNILAKSYNQQQLMDLVATVGQYNLVSMMLNTFGVQLDKGVSGFPKNK